MFGIRHRRVLRLPSPAATIAISACGTYAVTYQAIDPNLGNTVVSSWKYENIVLEQGDSPASATTEISTINAQQIL